MHTDAVDKRLRHVAQSLETADAFAGGCPARGLEATWLVFVVVRIFFAAPATAHQGALPSSTLWHANLYQPLVDLGHDVVVFDFDYSEFNRNLDPSDPKQRAFTAENRPRFSEQLDQAVRRRTRKSSGRSVLQLLLLVLRRAGGDPRYWRRRACDRELVLQRLVSVRPRPGDCAGLQLLLGSRALPARRLSRSGRDADLLPGGGESSGLPSVRVAAHV